MFKSKGGSLTCTLKMHISHVFFKFRGFPGGEGYAVTPKTSLNLPLLCTWQTHLVPSTSTGVVTQTIIPALTELLTAALRQVVGRGAGRQKGHGYSGNEQNIGYYIASLGNKIKSHSLINQ